MWSPRFQNTLAETEVVSGVDSKHPAPISAFSTRGRDCDEAEQKLGMYLDLIERYKLLAYDELNGNVRDSPLYSF